MRETSTGRLAITTPSSVHVFTDLPGLHAASFGSGDPATSTSPPASSQFTFAVTDWEDRFIPFCFTTEVPQQGLYVPPCIAAASPPEALDRIPLFSTPSRPVQPGFAAVRADLWDALADAPAAGAVLEVSGVGANPWCGIADWRGRVVVQCPYPEPRWPVASPPAGSAALSEQNWAVGLTVRYSPTQSSPVSASPDACQPPDLCEVLTQPTGTLLASYPPSSALPPQTLTFGRELVLRSTGRSVLLVLPT
ncbi:MAG TPA: hypothetical protein VMA77_09505 [Solirubrobacteraceae bacterium]|nr:hypothetical protein [Solirubrobacteraceae bacterium]